MTVLLFLLSHMGNMRLQQVVSPTASRREVNIQTQVFGLQSSPFFCTFSPLSNPAWNGDFRSFKQGRWKFHTRSVSLKPLSYVYITFKFLVIFSIHLHCNLLSIFLSWIHLKMFSLIIKYNNSEIVFGMLALHVFRIHMKIKKHSIPPIPFL